MTTALAAVIYLINFDRPILLFTPAIPVSPVLTPFEIISIVGFAAGAVLHLYLCWLLYYKYGLRRVERALLGLGLSVGLWHLGNFNLAMHEALQIRAGTWWMKGSNILAYAALTFLPPLLAHSHFIVWRWFDPRAPKRLLSILAALGYVPLLGLPWIVMELWSDPYQPPIEKLSFLLLPFIGWIVFIFLECALIDWRLARMQPAGRERRFFVVFAWTLLSIGVLFLVTYVVGARRWGTLGEYLDLLARLSSIAPTAIVAYYIYQYRYLELIIRQSLLYAIMAVIVLMIYSSGIRRFSLYLYTWYGLRVEAVEALLILVMILLTGPLRRLTEKYLHRQMVSEVGLYRDLVAQVGDAGTSSVDLRRFIEFTENRLKEALNVEEIRIIPARTASGEEAAVCRVAEEKKLTEIEDRELLERLAAIDGYTLWREGRVVGLLLVRGAPQLLTFEKREVLSVLAGHLAVAIENSQLLEEKVKLERDLAERERLAALGQMAATVAHEVKNPLSAIKSIAQVMREDEAVRKEYARDLDLITGEVDRLSRSVSQLLSFSRPAVVAAASSTLREIVDDAIAIAQTDAHQRGVKILSDLEANPRFGGEQTVALKEILINLTLNAAQSIKDGGEVKIQGEAESADRYRLSVIDDGIGVPSSMQEKIFEPFFTTKQRGTGLGLAIVARRVREIGGSIYVTSPTGDGRGTRFDLIVPVTI
jgi:signal transduction histidine kinase